MTHAETILVVGDTDRQMQSALASALPAALLTPVPGFFDAIAELSSKRYSAIFAAAEPIERRPESAVRTLRELAPESRLLLFGHPTLEPLSRKMLEFGVDDYLVTPPAPAEIVQMFRSPPVRLAAPVPSSAYATGVSPDHPNRLALLLGLPLAELFLDTLLKHPQDAVTHAIRQINAQIGPTMQVSLLNPNSANPTPAAEGMSTILAPVRVEGEEFGNLQLVLARDDDASAARHFLAQLALLVGKTQALQRRHNGLQKLAITDELTGLYNGRYFRHFLAQILEKARTMRFSVTLLLFDIDDFKKYNDMYGHSVGDEILRQTGSLMKRCCRDHDLVSRISGDEFAVVFWEKEGPRQPREAKPGQVIARVPQTPLVIAERFRRMVSSDEFTALGPTGKGQLTISGGMAVYPWNAQDVQSLIDAADKALMFGAKQQGKNSINLVGPEVNPY